MCDPLTIAGAALSAGGIAANSVAQSQVAAASNRAVTRQRQQQAELQQEAAATQAHSNSLYEGFAGKQADRAADLTTYLRSNQLPAQGSAATTVEAAPTSSNITTQGEASQRAKADKFADQQAGALGTMRSFGDLLGTNALSQARDAGTIGQLGNFMKGDASVLPLQLNAAQQSANGLKMLGGLASGLGKVGIAAGLSGGFGGAKTAAAAATGALPSFAATPSLGSIANAYSGVTAAPLTLGRSTGAVPAFASSPYSAF